MFVTSSSALMAAEPIREQSIRFDIPRQHADLALTQFAEQANLTLIFPFDDVRGKTANRLDGEYSIKEAIDILLRGTGLIPTLSNRIVLNIAVAEQSQSSDDGGSMNSEKKAGLVGAFLTSAFVGLGNLLSSDIAIAQATAQAERQLEEIVVTATKRDTALIDVPLAINVFTSDDLERMNLTRPGDVLSMVPNVHLTDAIRPGSNDVSVRGVQGNYGLTQPVALVIDGVATANPRGLDRELVGVEQIEVVRGPQSAVYGRNANAGAIVINTIRPSDDFFGKFLLGVGNGEALKAQAMVSGPIVEGRMYGRLALSGENRAGYWPNETLSHPADGFYEYVADGRLVYDATDRLTIDLRVRGSNLRQGAELWTMQVPSVHPFDVNGFFPPFQMNNESAGYQDRSDLAVKVDYELPFATLTAIGAYSDYHLEEVTDGGLILTGAGGSGGAPLAFIPGGPELILGANPPLLVGFSYSLDDGNSFIEQEHADTTIELRLASPSDGRLRWMGGVYYADTEAENYNSGRVDTGAGVIREQLAPVLFDINSSNPIRNLRSDKYTAEAKAVFGQVQYDISDRLEVSAAIRWDEETKKTINTVPTGNSPVTGLPLTDPVAAPTGQVRQDTFDKVQPQVSLHYRLNTAMALYTSYGEGFRSGGFNAAGIGPEFGYPEHYPSEISHAYEIGMKSQWLDRRMILNVALFHTEIDGAQAFVYFATPRSATINISHDEVRARGFEIESTIRLTDQLFVSNNFGLTDAEIIRDSLQGAVGKKVPQMPEYTNSLSVDYYLPFFDTLTLASHIGWSLEGPMWFDVYNTPYAERDPVNLVNARIAIAGGRENGDEWELVFWGKNLFNEWYNQYAAPAGPVMNVYRGVPRSYGANIVYKF
jgi:iron complex outermembrane receptor protein